MQTPNIHKDCAILQNMKHISVFPLILLCMAAITLASCKKGDNDPLLSLRTRSARVVGEWKLHSGSIVYTEPFSPDIRETYTNYQVTRDTAGRSVTNAFTWMLSFENDGTFTQVITETTSGNVSREILTKGRWQFLLRNEKEDLKNREAIILTETLNTYSSAGFSSSNFAVNPVSGMIWKFEELSHHQLVVKSNMETDVPPGVRKKDVRLTFRSLKKSVVV